MQPIFINEPIPASGGNVTLNLPIGSVVMDVQINGFILVFGVLKTNNIQIMPQIFHVICRDLVQYYPDNWPVDLKPFKTLVSPPPYSLTYYILY